MTDVVVPKEKLKELDDARLRLHEILEKTGLHNDAEAFCCCCYGSHRSYVEDYKPCMAGGD